MINEEFAAIREEEQKKSDFTKENAKENAKEMTKEIAERNKKHYERESFC